ncbi:uncharacterized protein DUF3810 [Alkalibaculum bacchi]|uniref:Uncharacterized protein DUF3810 n=1 Tax=Alkalibaculum bacchi TaxID=645887 RepID=A0A366I9S6_9FIRM|nr:DUF3810 domain-containing protein [Alkalibaculum bacchi]RBP66702.1 uncharacterized protein DUF3810 [Alkalibaculum bacchi]
MVVSIFIAFIAFLTWLLTIFASKNPETVESMYSSTIYPYIAKFLSAFNGFVPISLAEILLFVLLLFLVLLLLKPKLFFNKKTQFFHFLVRTISLLYIGFYLLWGFNYYRLDYIEIANMNTEPATMQELEELTVQTIRKINLVRQGLQEDSNGVFVLKDSFGELSKKAQKAFYKEDNDLLFPINGHAKPIFLSQWMSFTGIMGIYIPYTFEPNINTDIPPQNLPSTIIHEMAHQRGFAKEEEANFIAYKVSTNHSDPIFQYSGYYLAMQYLMEEMHKLDESSYKIIYSTISDAVKRDMEYSRNYWKAKEGKAEELAHKLNDNYLKANNQTQGILSYNGVVKLLLSDFKDTSSNSN